MSKWLLDRLFTTEKQPTPRFAFQGTVNWMRALALIVEAPGFHDTELREFYANVQRRPANPVADTGVFENLLMSIHQVASLGSVNRNINDRYDVVRSAIVAWYYAVYAATRAMVLATSGASPEQHRATAKVWHRDIVQDGLAVRPFGLSLSTLVATEVKKQVANLRGHLTHALNTPAENLDEAWGAAYSYLSGTAEDEKSRMEGQVRSTSEFKKLGVNDFRTKAARELRDRALSKGRVNFLIQAFRYRGKANYRDAIYLTYGDTRTEEINQFTRDLETVATAHLRMAGHYANRRVEKGTWNQFIDDLEANLRVNFDLSRLRVDAGSREG